MTHVFRLARPKINLFLHVTGRRDDGYHLLESLVSFAEFGDTVRAEPADFLSLSVEGPFAETLEGGRSNLVLRAAEALQDWARDAGHDVSGAALVLEKHLPIASGIGGGSADAAAAFNALNSLWELDVPRADLEALALGIGADVPVCLESRSRVMRGIGEVLTEAPRLPPAWLVLANPMREVSTAKVFSALDLCDAPEAVVIPEAFDSALELEAWLTADTRNDLEQPARMIEPEIDAVLSALSACEGVHLARMSGSGATCFALFDGLQQAEAAAQQVSAGHPTWWVAAAALT